MFPFSVPLGFQRSRASRSGSSGSAAALRSGSALGLALFACNPLVFLRWFLSFSFVHAGMFCAPFAGYFWTRPSKRGVCKVPC